MKRKRTARDEGAVLVWVGVMLVVILGMAAIVLDLGALYVERRELQNGADSAALAVAQECAQQTTCATAIAPATLAKAAADGNADDGAAGIGEVCGSGGGLPACTSGSVTAPAGSLGWVRVRTETLTASGQTEVPLRFAPVIGIDSADVRANAVAAWGTASSASTIPFVMCQNQYLLIEAGGLPSSQVIIFSKAQGGGNSPSQPPDCPAFGGGGTAPGNFSWLTVAAPKTDCLTSLLSIGSNTFTGAGNPGSNNPLDSECRYDKDDLLGKQFALPLFSTVTATGNNTTYTITGFALFEIQGFDLTGNPQDWRQTAGCINPPRGGNLRFFCGRFVKGTIPGTIGPGSNFGATTVQMIG